MTITIATLRAAGLSAEQIVDVLEVAERARAEKRREQNRVNQANSRSRRQHVSADMGDIADRADNADVPPPSKVPPITPLNTPQGSEPKGSAADAAPPSEVEIVDEDPKAKLFRLGKTVLVSFGVAEKRTGGLLGQWLKARNDPAGLLAAIQFARDQNVAEPVAYVSALVSGKGNKNGQFGALATAADDLIAREEKRELEDAAFTLDLTPGRG